MSEMSEQEKATRRRIKQAFDLAKKGQYGKARFILNDIDHPAAKKLLSKIEGQQDQRKNEPKIVTPLRLAVGFFIVLAMGGIIPGSWWYRSTIGQKDLVDLFSPGFDFENVDPYDYEFTEEEFLYYEVVNYCYGYTNYGGELCLDWADMVTEDHADSAETCLEPYRENAFLEDEDIIDIRECLLVAGVPDPF